MDPQQEVTGCLPKEADYLVKSPGWWVTLFPKVGSEGLLTKPGQGRTLRKDMEGTFVVFHTKSTLAVIGIVDKSLMPFPVIVPSKNLDQ